MHEGNLLLKCVWCIMCVPVQLGTVLSPELSLFPDADGLVLS